MYLNLAAQPNHHDLEDAVGRVVIDISVSLDGYVTGPNDNPDDGLGAGGDRLHDWYLESTEEDTRLIDESEKDLGALICGRRTYDNSLKYWGSGGPHGSTPVFVVSHSVHEPGLADGKPFTFVDNIQSAYDLAKKTAGDRDVRVMGGADIPQQFLKAGLIDEVTIHLVPAFTGGGQRLFDNLGPDVKLEQAAVVGSPAVTHLTFRPVR